MILRERKDDGEFIKLEKESTRNDSKIRGL